MADIDYFVTLDNGFEISFGDNPTACTGNKLLANRFEITFLTNTRNYLLGDAVVTDNYGGDSQKYIGQPLALNNIQSISAAITVAMNLTIESIKNNQSTINNAEEKLDNAELVSIEIIVDIVYATIKIIPMAYSSGNELYFTIPVRSI